MKKSLLLIMTVCVSFFATARTVTLKMSDYAATSFTAKDLTLTATKGTGYQAPAYNATYGDLRIYANGTLTIDAGTAHITAIEFTISEQGKQQLASLTVNSGNVTVTKAPSVDWIGSSNSVTFTLGAKADFGTKPTSAAQLCFTAVKVITDGTGPDDDDCTLDLTQEFDIVKGHAIYYPQNGTVLKSFYLQVFSDFEMEYDAIENDWIIASGTGAFYTFDIYPTSDKSFVGTYTSLIGDNKVGGLGIKNQSSLFIHKCENNLQSFLKSGSVTVSSVRDNLYNVTYNVTDADANRHEHTWIEIPIVAYDEFGGNHAIVNEQTAIDYVECTLEVYTRGSDIVVPAEIGQRIEICNVMGQTIYVGLAQSLETVITNLPTQQILIVRVGNKTAKVIL